MKESLFIFFVLMLFGKIHTYLLVEEKMAEGEMEGVMK
jgi:hypothetical protein